MSTPDEPRTYTHHLAENFGYPVPQPEPQPAPTSEDEK